MTLHKVAAAIQVYIEEKCDRIAQKILIALSVLKNVFAVSKSLNSKLK